MVSDPGIADVLLHNKALLVADAVWQKYPTLDKLFLVDYILDMASHHPLGNLWLVLASATDMAEWVMADLTATDDEL